MLDNAFDSIESYPQTQELSDGFNIEELHKSLMSLPKGFCQSQTEQNSLSI